MGLLGPLSLIALVAGRRMEDGNGNEECKLRSAALRMMKEYLSCGSGDEGEEAGSGQFWSEYFRRLGFIEALPLGT